MTITIGCPICGSTYNVSSRNYGKKTFCVQCGQRLQVPRPVVRSQTILATEIPAPNDGVPRAPTPENARTSAAIRPACEEPVPIVNTPPPRSPLAGKRPAMIAALAGAITLVFFACGGLCLLGVLLPTPANGTCPMCHRPMYVAKSLYSDPYHQVDVCCPHCHFEFAAWFFNAYDNKNYAKTCQVDPKDIPPCSFDMVTGKPRNNP